MTRTASKVAPERSIPVEQPTSHVCADCQTPLERVRRRYSTGGGRDWITLGVPAERCATCRRRHRRRALLRAYLVSASKLATEFGQDDFALELHRLAERARS